jgi:hypothetical protein
MLTSNLLRGLACLFMLSDHLWATLVPGNMWMTYLGRLAFPIFAFQITEGYRHTSDFRKYAQRLLIFGLISEIPFNLMYAGSVIFPFHQNVMFTLLLGLLSIRSIDTVCEIIKSHGPAKSLVKPVLIVAGCLLGATVGFVDYGFWGVMIMIAFHIFRGFRGAWIFQLAAMIYINCEAFQGMFIPVEAFGQTIEFATQGFAVLALIPIWLYSGRKGKSSKALQYGFYAFYPVHMLILALLRMYL